MAHPTPLGPAIHSAARGVRQPSSQPRPRSSSGDCGYGSGDAAELGSDGGNRGQPQQPRAGTYSPTATSPVTNKDSIDEYIEKVYAGSRKDGKDVKMPEEVKKLTKVQAEARANELVARADTLKQKKGLVLQDVSQAEKENKSQAELDRLNAKIASIEDEESKLSGVAHKTEAQTKGTVGRFMEKSVVQAIMGLILPLAMFAPAIMQFFEWIGSKCSSNNASQPQGCQPLVN